MASIKMSDTLRVLNRLQAEGVIGTYAIAGAIAAFRHIEATLTDDLDLLVSIKAQGGLALVMLEPIFARLRAWGYSEFRLEGIVIEGWPVQFLPVASDLDAEALEQAENIELSLGTPEASVRTRALRAEHVVAIAVKVGRPKDFVRIHQYLEEEAVDLDALRGVLVRHGLKDRWQGFCKRTGVADPIFG